LVVTIALSLGAIPAAAGLQGPLAELEPLLGTWEVEATWAGGQALWSRAEYVAGIGGRTIEASVFVKDGDGEPYQRYFTVFSIDAERDQLVAHFFNHDGSYQAMDFNLDGRTLSTEWTEGGTAFRDRSELVGDDRLHWTVEMRPADASELTTIMDAVWHKQSSEDEDEMSRTINTELFAASGKDIRSFVKETLIEAPVEAVYAAWTDGAVFPRVYDPSRPEIAANIELAIGGPYEWLWDGRVGSNGCQVLSYIPNRMVSFSWNAPPSQPESRARHTWVVVELADTGEGATYLTLTHLGFGSEPHWDETFEYFGKAWPQVLAQLKKNLESTAGELQP
jgi:uncharacterized protein YndB with AHSA1/START domain